MIRKVNWSVVALAVTAALFVASQWVRDDRQADVEKVVQDTARQARANCVVVSVLLGNRADRDTTVKLFEPIRRQNPEQFDKLVERAEEGDERLAGVQGDLACDVEPAPPREYRLQPRLGD